MNTAAVKILGDEYTYYTVTRTEDAATGTTLALEPQTVCEDKDLPQRYSKCKTDISLCKAISKITVQYTTSTIEFVQPVPEGISDLQVDSSSSIDIASYSDKSKCKTSVLPDNANFKHEKAERVQIITKDYWLIYNKNEGNMKYQFYKVTKANNDLYGNTIVTRKTDYNCPRGGSSGGLSASVVYYKDPNDNKEYYKIGKALAITADESDIKLVEERSDKNFCPDPQPIGDKIVKSHPDNGIYKIFTNDKNYIIKDNTFQFATKMTRNTAFGNKYTSFTITNEDITNIDESETGYYKEAFTQKIQNDFGCTAPNKDFISISWCKNSCDKKTGVLDNLKNELNTYLKPISLNLAIKKDTTEVYVYKEEDPLSSSYGTVIESFIPKKEDLAFSVLPTLLFIFVLMFLL